MQCLTDCRFIAYRQSSATTLLDAGDHHMKRVLVLALAASVSACAQPTSMRPGIDPEKVQQERTEQLKAAAEKKMGQYRRLYGVSQRIAVAEAEFCGEKVYRTSGVALNTLSWIDEKEAELAKTADSKTDWRPRVWFFVQDSPAQKSGLWVTDEVLSINGMPITSKAELERVKAKIREKDVTEHVFEIRRYGEKKEIRAKTELACDYPVSLKESNLVNAFADGRNVVVMTGMMDFVRSDEELAVVLGHELAHNLRGHLDAKRQNELGGRIAGAVLDGLVAAATRTMPGNTGQSLGGAMASQAYSVDFESEADYVGLYVMARAGYDITKAPDFWRRMGAANPQSVTHATTHPSTPERFVALKASVEEIQAKRTKGEPLLPNEKVDQ
jgi:Zn-dependent protease with chaperone function